MLIREMNYKNVLKNYHISRTLKPFAAFLIFVKSYSSMKIDDFFNLILVIYKLALFNYMEILGVKKWNCLTAENAQCKTNT
jgi:hypothetical protein